MGPNLLPQKGAAHLVTDFLESAEADMFLKALIEETPWRDDKIVLFGKTVAQPRRTAWYGDPQKTYTYSGLKMSPLPWTPRLFYLKKKVERLAQTSFNSVLLNLYRHQRDSMGWHRDNEPELGRNPQIASISLGEPRPFVFRLHKDPSTKVRLDLPHGSLLLMSGETQHHWEHALPKRTRPMKERVNLTFRTIL